MKKARFWFKNEKQLMRSLGLDPTPGSGNRVVKEDGQNDYVIAQLKSTEGSSISIRLQDVTSLLFNATVTHKLPMFISQFIDGPILISCRLEDLPQIAEYIKCGVAEKRTEHVTIVSDQKSRPKVRTGNIRKVRQKLEAEREERYRRK